MNAKTNSAPKAPTEQTPEQIAEAAKTAAAAAKEKAAAEKKEAADKAKATAQAEKDKATALKKAEKEKAEKEAQEAKDKAAAEKAKDKETKAAQKAKDAEAKQKEQMPSKNGVTRPRTGGPCGDVWALADKASKELGRPTPIGALKAMNTATEKPINDATLRTQYARWKMHNSVFTEPAKLADNEYHKIGLKAPEAPKPAEPAKEEAKA